MQPAMHYRGEVTDLPGQVCQYVKVDKYLSIIIVAREVNCTHVC